MKPNVGDTHVSQVTQVISKAMAWKKSAVCVFGMYWVSHQIQEREMRHMRTCFWCWHCIVWMNQGHEKSWSRTHNIRDTRLGLLDQRNQETFWSLKSRSLPYRPAGAGGEARGV